VKEQKFKTASKMKMVLTLKIFLGWFQEPPGVLEPHFKITALGIGACLSQGTLVEMGFNSVLAYRTFSTTNLVPKSCIILRSKIKLQFF
jgi:hypothetical protein